MPSLKELIGKEISVSTSVLGAGTHIEATLVEVEDAGLWLQGDLLGHMIIGNDNPSKDEGEFRPQVFFPFSAIHYVVDLSD